MKEQWANAQEGKGKMPGYNYIKKRATFVSGTDPEVVYLIAPGATQFIEVEIENGTHWPWKQGCWLGMADLEEGSEEAAFMPIEHVYVPVTFDVPAQHKFKI